MEQRDTLLRNVGSADFASVVLQSEKPVLVDFTAAWCGPCRAIAPVIASLAEEYADRLTVATVDIDANAALAAEYRVRSVPTVMLIADGEIRRILVGARSAQEYRDGVEALLH